jgi:hypothetical protein
MEMLERIVLRWWLLGKHPQRLFTIRQIMGLSKDDLFNNMGWPYTSFGEAAILNDTFFKVH